MRPYKIDGSVKRGFAVLDGNGGILYDLLETRKEAEAIRDALNSGCPEDWDSVSKKLGS
jgi:hypothetical protein